ncbi:MAG: TIGR02206 family membrane protein [Thermoleophilia bacterium]
MEQFSATHLIALAVTAAIAVAAGAWARRHRPGDARLLRARRILAAAMVASEAALRTAVYAIDGVRPGANLPLHLTHATWLVCVIALWTARPIFFELAYFWGAAAVVQAMVTPSLSHDFPDVRFWEFMAIHAPVIVGIVFMAWGCRMTPRGGAVSCAWFASWAVFAIAAAASAITGGNYMFARRPPPQGSLIDWMGPWPWYLATAALMALLVFWLLDRPFGRRRATQGG